jgi:imidazolonepropionase-like amidohydrolase
MATGYRIDADLMVPGSGAPVTDATVVVDGDIIAYAGPTASAPEHRGPDVRVPVVLPGLWDCHCHLFGITAANLEHLATEPVPVRAMRIGRDVNRALMAGFTSLREVGGLGVHLARVVNEGTIVGPAIYAAGSLLSTTGGHGDVHSLPLDVVDSCERMHDLEICDGVPECLRAVRRQLRMGARVIKVCATGGVLSELDHPEHAQFSHDELVAIVEEAARAERIVAAHCHGKAGIMAAVRAGVRTIEHGTYLDAESAMAMADTGTILVATRFIGEALLADDSTTELPEFARRKLVETSRRGKEGVAHAIAAGVTIAAGTDIITSGDMWGRNGRELGLLVECGLSPVQAIEAATATGPLTVGPQAAKTGILAAGFAADIIAVSSDPLADIGVLADAESVTHVWRTGRLVKGSVVSS